MYIYSYEKMVIAGVKPIYIAFGFVILACLTFLLRNVRKSLITSGTSKFRSTGEAKHGFLANKYEQQNEPPEIRIAYCVFPQSMRPSEPVIGAEYLAKKIGLLAFPDKRVELVTCMAVPEQLPSNIKPESKEGLKLLGLLDVHVRFCSYGSSSLLKGTFEQLARAYKDRIRLKKIQLNSQLRKAKVNPQVDKLVNLLHHQQDDVSLFMDTSMSNANGGVIGPLITRMNRESWYESVPGVAVQFDTKIAYPAADSMTIYMPYAYEHFGRSRWNGDDPNRKMERHEERYGKNDQAKIREAVTRPTQSGTFSATQERANKKHFMAMINSNCRSGMPSTMIRGLFTFAVHEITGKPVHNLGACPKDPEGSVRAGITPAERAEFAERWPRSKDHRPSTQDIFSLFKFAVVFENADVEGYVTEKMVTAYNARTIPVYWGGGSMAEKVYNKKAFVHCQLPNNVTRLLSHDYATFATSVCGIESSSSDDACKTKIQDEFYRRALPYFKPCIAELEYLDKHNEAYEAMLREPLATMESTTGELTGVWNESNYAVALRTVFDALDYQNGPSRLQTVLDQV